jgi:hypothetical protein
MKIVSHLRVIAVLCVYMVLSVMVPSVAPKFPSIGLSGVALAKNCVKGIPCGRTCIAAWKTCHVDSYNYSSSSSQGGLSGEEAAPAPAVTPVPVSVPASPSTEDGSPVDSAANSSGTSAQSRAAWDSIRNSVMTVIGVSASSDHFVLSDSSGSASAWKVYCDGKPLKVGDLVKFVSMYTLMTETGRVCKRFSY